MSQVTNVWHIDPAVYQKAKEQAVTDSIYSKTKSTPYVIIEGGESDKQKVIALYERCPVPGYAVTRVEVIYNRTLVQGFEAKIQALEQRYDNQAFNPRWSTETADPHQKKVRERIAYTLSREVEKYSVENRHVKILPMFHGTHKKLFDSIFRTGFDNLATTDAGYFGKGVYNTSYAEYAWRVYSTGGLVFNWIAFYSAFPVIKEDMKTLVGSAKYQNYDAHYALVRPMNPKGINEKIYIPIGPQDTPTYDELVVFESSQVLPRYVVTLAPVGANLKEMSPKANQASLLQAMTKLWKKAHPTLQGLLGAKMQEVKAEQSEKKGLTKEEEWMQHQIEEILATENDEDQTIPTVLKDQMVSILQISATVNPVLAEQKEESPEEKGAHTWSKGQTPKQQVIGSDQPKKSDLDTLYKQAEGLLAEKKEAEAFNLWKRAADLGHADSQYQLGQCYKLGRGVNRDYKLATHCSQKAADQGHRDALDYIGHCYYNGLSLPQDLAKAAECFKKAALGGNPSSMQYMVIMHTHGYGGLAQDPKEIFRYSKMAADKGNPQAQWQVSQFYKTATGVERNFPLAFAYALKAADLGMPDAQDYVGHCFYNGLSVEKSFEKAVHYFRLAAAQENASSIEYLGLCFAYGHGVPQDLQESFKFYVQAAGKGKASAQYTLGIYFKDGIGTAKDIAKAKHYLQLAEKQGFEKAKEALAAL